MKSLKKGFTLVELMVVIVIIGILAALAIPRFMGATNKTKATEFKPVLKQINTLQSAYRQERDVWGATADVIGCDLPNAMNAAAPGPSRFHYDVIDAGPGLGVVGKARIDQDGRLNNLDGTPMLQADSYICVDDAAAQTVLAAPMRDLSTLPIAGTCTNVFAPENI